MDLLCGNQEEFRKCGIRLARLLPLRGQAIFPMTQMHCLSSACARTRTSIKDTAIGGAVKPLSEPQPAKPKRWRAAITISLPGHSSVSASSYDDDSGEGNFTWQKRSSRVLRRNSRASRKNSNRTAAQKQPPDFQMLRSLGLVAGPNRKFSLRNCLQGLTLTASRKPLSTLLKRRKPSSTVRHDRKTKLDIKRNLTQDAILFSVDDSQYGYAKFSLISQKKLAASFRLLKVAKKQSPIVAAEGHVKRAEQTVNSGRGSPCVRSDIEYDWKKNSYTLQQRLETPRRALQLRIATNPLRITPRIQLPIGRPSSSSPYLSWTREPKAGIGEFEVGWKGVHVSSDLAHPCLSIRRKTSDGGYSAISLNNKRVLKVDQNLVSKPLCGGVVVTVTSCMTNQKHMTGASLAATAPWGSVSAHVRTSMACGFSVCSEMRRKQGSLRFQIAMENLKTASFRLGLFY